ncbi:MAG: hypothetical protein SVX43_10980 [Cyanobacteriota bacterium]|nr:hypothetical protein [Cyanobacteriota bacterium]
MSERLDRIEAALELLIQNQQNAIARQDRLDARVDRLAERFDGLTERVDRLAERSDQLTEQVNRLAEITSNLASSMETLQRVLIVEIGEFKANFMAVERRIEQIWQYLLNQFRSEGNGYGEGEDP